MNFPVRLERLQFGVDGEEERQRDEVGLEEKKREVMVSRDSTMDCA